MLNLPSFLKNLNYMWNLVILQKLKQVYNPANLNHEALRKNPFVREFSGIGEEVAKHHLTPMLFFDICKRICESCPE
ncbi:MAG: hypothetical protein PHV51_00695 [Methanosarcinaceae archaeon]|nr:hypothetical protein [Methanosarcinaceae archaeon]